MITAGTIPANPAELLGSRRMEAIVERLKESAEVVIFDTPPVTAVTDAALMAAKADATIMVIQSHRASRRIVAQGLEALTKVNARIVGAVLNNVPGHVATPYYGRSAGQESQPDRQAIDLPGSDSTGCGPGHGGAAGGRHALEADAAVQAGREPPDKRRGRPRRPVRDPRATSTVRTDDEAGGHHAGSPARTARTSPSCCSARATRSTA